MPKGTIFVVDDEPDIPKLIQFHLSEVGYQILPAGTREMPIVMLSPKRKEATTITGLELGTKVTLIAVTGEFPAESSGRIYTVKNTRTDQKSIPH